MIKKLQLSHSYIHCDLNFGRAYISGEGSIRDLFQEGVEHMFIDENIGNNLENLARSIYEQTGEMPVIHISNI
jgi:hypothetical protein